MTANATIGAASAANSATGFSDIYPDIIETHILTRLDGCSLAAVNCASSQLRSLSSHHDLWSSICHSTWPSTSTPRVQQVVSTFSNGPLSFFSLCSPLLPYPNNYSCPSLPSSAPPSLDLLLSAVDILYRGEPVLSKTCETETVTSWFKCAPFRVDLLDPKEIVSTPIPRPNTDETCLDLYRDLELSWIVIDPIGRRAANVSSVKPVSIHRHWLSGEIQAKFASVIGGGHPVAIIVEVTFAAGEGEGKDGELAVREVGLEVEGVDGVRLSGKESLEVLKRGLQGGRKRRRDNEEEEGEDRRKCYENFIETRRQRKATKVREEGTWDLMCAGTGLVVTTLAVLGYFGSFWS